MRLARPKLAVWRAVLFAQRVASLAGMLVTVTVFRRLIVFAFALPFVVAEVVTGGSVRGTQAHIWAGAHLAADTTTTQSISTYDAAFKPSLPTLVADRAGLTDRSIVSAVPLAGVAARRVGGLFRVGYYSPANKITVITESDGKIVTVTSGAVKIR